MDRDDDITPPQAVVAHVDHIVLNLGDVPDGAVARLLAAIREAGLRDGLDSYTD